MKKIRTIPYGYLIQNGRTMIHKHEAEVVAEIYDRYLAGESMIKIAEILTIRGEIYFNGNSKWNKNMIARILEKEIYTGIDPYEAIINKPKYEKIHSIRKKNVIHQKSKHHENDINMEPLRKRTRCSICNQIPKMKKRHSGDYRWRCPNCGIAITDTALYSLIKNKITSLKSNKELYQPQEYNPLKQLKLALLERDINNDFEQDFPNSNELLKQIKDYSELAYQYCTEGTEKYSTTIIQDTLNAPLPCLEIMDKIIKKIEIGDHEIMITLINGTTLNGG